MAFTRLGSNVSLSVFGCWISLIVIHGYFLWNRASWPSNAFSSAPDHRVHLVSVTGVLSVEAEVELLDEPLEPQPAATSSAPRTASPNRSPADLDRVRWWCANRVIRRSPFARSRGCD